jgi:hypothetical protein
VKRKKKERSVEEEFPNARARQAADEAIDKLGVDQPMHVYLDTWEAAYFAVAGRSPFRKNEL